MRPAAIALVLGATLRLTRLATTDDLGLWTVKTPAYNWAARHEPPMPVIEPWEGSPQPVSMEHIRVPGWRLRLVSGLDCPFCVGFWIGAGVLATQAMCSRSPVAAKAWRSGAAALALNYVAGHVSSRLDG